MIIVMQGTGQLCNRLVFLVHALATALDARQSLVHFFARDVFSFSDTHPEAISECRIRCFRFRFPKIINAAELWLMGLDSFSRRYYLANARRIHNIATQRFPKVHVLWNWFFRNDDAIVRHRNAICAYLKASDKHMVRPMEVVSKLRKKGTVLVGVHIRRGDYRTFNGGRFFFSDEEYSCFMRQFKESSAQHVQFLIVSNECVSPKVFCKAGLDVYFSRGTPQEDILCLSLCDYILGPVSTFSWFAAYYGGKPYRAIYAHEDKTTMDTFGRVSGPEIMTDKWA